MTILFFVMGMAVSAEGHGPGSESLGKALVTARAVAVGEFKIKEGNISFAVSEVVRGTVKKKTYPVLNRSANSQNESEIHWGPFPNKPNKTVQIPVNRPYLVPLLSATDEGIVVASSRYDRNNRGYAPFVIGNGTRSMAYLKPYGIKGISEIKSFLKFINNVRSPSDLIPFMKKDVTSRTLCLEILVGTEFFHQIWKRTNEKLYRYRFQAEAVLLNVARPRGKKFFNPFYLNDFLNFVKRELRMPLVLGIRIHLQVLKRYLEKEEGGYRAGELFSNNLLASLNDYAQIIADRKKKWTDDRDPEVPVLSLGASPEELRRQFRKFRHYLHKNVKYALFENDFPSPVAEYDDGLFRWVTLTRSDHNRLRQTAEDVLSRLAGKKAGFLSLSDKKEKESWEEWSKRIFRSLFPGKK